MTRKRHAGTVESRKLVVEAPSDRPDILNNNVRNVYLVRGPTVEMSEFGVPCVGPVRSVVSLVLWAESLGIEVEYHPEENMEKFFRDGDRPDQLYLFD